MLSPEVSTFPAPRSWKRCESGSNIKEIHTKHYFKQNNEVINSVKLFLPECLHPPDELRKILLHDKDFYLVENIQSLECCATEDFIKSFIYGGNVFLQTLYGK